MSLNIGFKMLYQLETRDFFPDDIYFINVVIFLKHIKIENMFFDQFIQRKYQYSNKILKIYEKHQNIREITLATILGIYFFAIVQ